MESTSSSEGEENEQEAVRKQQAIYEKEKVNGMWSVCITSNRRKNAVNNYNNNLACLMMKAPQVLLPRWKL